MKTVFTSNSEIAHLWAHQLQDEAKNPSRNFYFNGEAIYSYGGHFMIAKHVENDRGEKAVLMTERTYSNTTAKHINIVRHAINHLNIIHVPDPSNANADWSANFDAWQLRIERIAESLSKARKPEIYLNQIEQVRIIIMRYVEFFGLTIPATLQAAMAINGKESLGEYSEAKKKAMAERERLRKIELKKQLNKWLGGEGHTLYNRYDDVDYLRVKDDRVETSQGIKLTIPYAKKLYDLVLSNKLNVGDKVLEFSVSSVTDTHIRIGCHNFTRKYLIEFGSKL